ncbi:MAG: prephenate dehydratase [Flavobacteriaceae bacterium]|nr:MAG: prephenate dehydratase [Flavobacteriaceae bacterium]
MKEKVAIQGVGGSYHHQAAIEYFGDPNIQIVPCDTFKELVEFVSSDEVPFGLMAIENSIAGSILPNYGLLHRYELKVIGEIYMPIHHHLLALPGQKLEDLHQVRSHYMALLQCDQFFEDKKYIKLVEEVDTAKVAQQIQQENLMGVGAIASKICADIYGLNILSDAIQNNADNFTRFFVVQKETAHVEAANKASIRFELDHQKGSLARFLTVIWELGMDLTKIQSAPIANKPWAYAFFVDLLFEDPFQIKSLDQKLKEFSQDFQWLGTYKNGNQS